jgi:hypothetical protein
MHDVDPGFESDDNSIPEGSSALKWSTLFFEACEKIGHAIPAPAQYKSMMQEAGFVDVQLKVLKRPTNVWPKDKQMKRIGLVSFLSPCRNESRSTERSMIVYSHQPYERCARFYRRAFHTHPRLESRRGGGAAGPMPQGMERHVDPCVSESVIDPHLLTI